ncbi:MAG: hypothetical protein WCX73_04045 [Candidatus Pacearchaeota archaeon]|jgi:hypothetical protein
MEDLVDKTVINNEFLKDFFPELTPEKSEQKYLLFKNQINSQRTKNNKIPLTDSDLCQVIETYSKIKNTYLLQHSNQNL